MFQLSFLSHQFSLYFSAPVTSSWSCDMPRLSPVYDRFLRLVVATFVGLLLVGCEPKLNTSADHLQTITMLDRQQLPAGHWALSNSIIQLSFCRSEERRVGKEVKLWRLSYA